MKNKIITSEGNIQFIDSEGKVINISPSQVYSMINEDTISFLLVHLPKSSGLSLFTTKVEDLELNGTTYSQSTIADALAEAFSEAGAVGRIEVVDELPSKGKTNTIYLLPKDEGEGYDEYIYLKDEQRWELVGDTSVEIKNYLKKSDFNEYSAATKTAIDSKQGTLIAGENITISGNVISATGGDLSNYYTKSETSGATEISTALASKQTTLTAGTNITIVDNVISADGGSITIDQSLDSGSTNAVANSAITNAINSKMDEVNFASFYGNRDYSAGLKGYYYDSQTETQTQKFDWGMVWQSDGSIGFDGEGNLAVFGKLDTTAFTAHTADTVIHVTSAEKAAWNAKSDFSGDYNDLSNKLSAGTGIDITDNVISTTGSGGKAIKAGRGISITTGETADTVSFNLPISAGTGSGSIICSRNDNKASGSYSFAGGEASSATSFWSFAYGANCKSGYGAWAGGFQCQANSNYSFAIGERTRTSNDSECSIGHYNVTNTSSTNDLKTLFSVGNGTPSARHNAFEIRQNGDIYITKDGQDVKLQDQLGGSSITVDTALNSGSTNPVENRVIYNKIDEVEQVTAAGLNALNESKQDTLISGTNIKTINNESILGSGNITIEGGGGKAVSGGTNISITTGETADTINCTLPFEKISTNSVTLGGFSNTIKGVYCYIGGHNNVINNYGSKHYIIGDNNKIGLTTSEPNFYHTLTVGEYNINRGGVVFGRYNSSSNTTLFSVGNGTDDNARHNAFEIRQNGDIYLTKDGQDVKLQDALGGTVDTALDSGSTNPVENRVIYNKIDEVEQVTAAGLNALNDNFGGMKLVKLSEAEYNALATKDASTLYIIVN